MATVVLVVAGAPRDAGLLAALRGATSDVTCVGTLLEGVAALTAQSYDCVLLEIPRQEGPYAVDAVRAVAPDVAVVAVTVGRDVALEAVRRGAEDYLLVDELAAPVVERAMRYAVDRATVRASLAHRQAEQRALVENLGEGVIVQGAAGAMLEWNAAAERILGLTAAELAGRTSSDTRWGAVHEDGRSFAAEEHPSMVALRTGGRVDGVIMGIDHPAKGRRWIEINASPLVKPGHSAPYAAVTSFRDVTARREAEAEVRIQAALLDAAGNAIVATDPDGTIRYWNPGAEAVYGWRADEVLGRAAYEVPAFAGLRAQGEEISAHITRGESWTGDVDAARKDGTPIRTLVTATPLFDAGRLVMVIAVATDISARRAAEDEARRLSAIVDSSEDAIIGRTLDGVVTSWNTAAERLTGYPADEAIGKHATFTAVPGRAGLIHGVLDRVRRGEVVPPYETVVVRKDGTHVDISLTISPIRDESGTVIGSSAIARDITEQVRLRRAAEDDRRRLAEAQAVANLGSFEHVVETGQIKWSDELYRIFGFEVGIPLDLATVTARLHPDDLAGFAAGRATALETGEPVDIAYRVLRPDGDVRQVHARIRANTTDGDGSRLVGTVLDVTERARADDERRRAEHRFELGFERAAAGVAIADVDGRFVRVNAALCRLLGRAEEDLLGRHPDEFLHPQWAGGPSPFAEAAGGETRAGVEVRFARPNGDGLDALVDVTVVCGDSGKPEYLFAQLLDITRRKQAERALAHQALHDSLTGLPNRVLLLDRLDHALLQRDRRTGSIAVLLIDLDQFKLVNDGMGHSAGDALLIEAATRLTKAVRPGDTVCRLGGDEFVVCCEDVGGPEGALQIGDRVRAAFAVPFVIDRRELFITASVGVALATPGAAADSLLRDADAAMYRAKERGRARVELFDEGLRDRATARLATTTALRRALAEGEFEVHYQPIVSLADDRLVGFEALVRWRDPERGLIPPMEFIGVAEETGLIVPLGAFVLHEATRQLAEWSATFPSAPDLTISVNVSGRQMTDSALVPTVADALRESGLAPNRLHLEITETVLMDDIEESMGVLRALDELGVTLEIDDFGTGYSSLSYLKRLPVDTLKVDRSFVSGLGLDVEDTSIVTAIAALGRALGLRLHAEGVENEQQRAAARAVGCDVAQGFHWSPPLPAGDAEAWLRRRALAVVPDQRGVRRFAAG